MKKPLYPLIFLLAGCTLMLFPYCAPEPGAQQLQQAPSNRQGPRRASSPSRMVYLSVPAPSEPLLDSIGVGVYVPAGYETSDASYPTIYFLHGFGGDETSWAQNLVPALLDTLINEGEMPPVLVVSPAGQDSEYLNWIQGERRGEDFIAQDLVPYIDRTFRARPSPRQRGLTGVSMGGVGALRIAFTHTALFGSVSAHSAALHPIDPGEMPDWAKGWDGWADRYGDPIDRAYWRAKNPLFLAETMAVEELSKLALYFDVGEEDHLGFNRTNEHLSEILTQRQIPHTFALRPGGHGNAYFQANVEASLLFHGRHFNP